MNCMDKYNILKKNLHKLPANIKFFTIYGEYFCSDRHKLNDVLIVTNDDRVFAFGHNSDGCLGLGTDSAVSEPTLLEPLFSKRITKICAAVTHVFAITLDGCAYGWGNNSFGQLGDGITHNISRPKLIEALSDHRIVDISCGANYSLALTDCGDVYAFGCNCFGQLGCNNTVDQLLPVKVNGFEGEKVLSVACGFEHTMAVTECGHVYGWGANNLGQLGLANREDQYTPTKIDYFDSIAVKKIVCGSAHTIVLTRDHHVYAFGFNFHGQIGCGDNDYCKHTPIRLNIGKCADICATFRSDMSVAKVLCSGDCYVWGQTRTEQRLISPTKTSIKCIDECFAEYCLLSVTHKQIEI